MITRAIKISFFHENHFYVTYIFLVIIGYINMDFWGEGKILKMLKKLKNNMDF